MNDEMKVNDGIVWHPIDLDTPVLLCNSPEVVLGCSAVEGATFLLFSDVTGEFMLGYRVDSRWVCKSRAMLRSMTKWAKLNRPY